MNIATHIKQHKQLGIEKNPVINVKSYGAVGDGTADDTGAVQTALDYIESITGWSGDASNNTKRPYLYFPAGVYSVDTTFNITSRGVQILGDGITNTTILWDGGDTPVFDIGTFSTTPANLYTGQQDARFQDLRIVNNKSETAGSRTGQGIRMSGGGSLVLANILVQKFAYGINAAYGCDFNDYRNIHAQQCDVGVYHGPASQQLYGAKIQVQLCVEGIVFDRPVYFYISELVMTGAQNYGITFDLPSTTSTRQCSTIPNIAPVHGTMVLDTPWFESDPAASNDNNAVPTYFIYNANTSVSPFYQGLFIRNPHVSADPGSSKHVTAFLGNASATYPIIAQITNARFSGTMDYWFKNPSANTRLVGVKVVSGETAPLLANYAGAEYYGRMSDVFTETETVNYSEYPINRTITRVDNGSIGIRYRITNANIVSWGVPAAGTYSNKMGMDVTNQRFFFGDGEANERSFSFANTMPSSGTYAAGSVVFNYDSTNKSTLYWYRLTTGSNHVLGTDWINITNQQYQISKTADFTVLVEQNRGHFDNTGATGSISFFPPAATVGLEYVFRRVASFNVIVNPNGAETFDDTATTKTLTTDGAFLHIRCYTAGTWHVVASFGTIT